MIQNAYREFVLDSLYAWRQEGWETCLVTVVQIDGGSPRPLGSQMAVRSDGVTTGLVTGGCAENAIIAEAQQAMREGSVRETRFGAGSPYLDIRLPCGTGLDLRFDPGPDPALIKTVLAARAERRPVALSLPRPDGDLSLIEVPTQQPRPFVDGSKRLIRPYPAALQLVVAGRGPLTDVLVRLALDMGIEVQVQTPDADVLKALEGTGVPLGVLRSPADFNAAILDSATALILLFHDHEWEPDILKQALARETLYIGALGSRSTHAERLSLLKDMGVHEEMLERIKGPVGLPIGAEGPIEIAVSILADLIQARRAAGLAPL